MLSGVHAYPNIPDLAPSEIVQHVYDGGHDLGPGLWLGPDHVPEEVFHVPECDGGADAHEVAVLLDVYEFRYTAGHDLHRVQTVLELGLHSYYQQVCAYESKFLLDVLYPKTPFKSISISERTL